MSIKFDFKEKGLKKLFNDYEINSLEYLWKSTELQSSREVWEHVTLIDGSEVSRASIINFLNQMVEEDFLDYEDTTGKGGIRRLYKHKHTKEMFITKIASNLIQSLMEDYEKETLLAMQKISPDKSSELKMKLIQKDLFVEIMKHFIIIQEASIEELYTVIVKYHGINIDKQTIKDILDISTLHPFTIKETGVYKINPDFI